MPFPIPYFIERTDSLVVTVADKVNVVSPGHRDLVTPVLVIIGWVVVHFLSRHAQDIQFRKQVVHTACQAVNADLLRFSRFLQKTAFLTRRSVDEVGNFDATKFPAPEGEIDAWDWWATLTGNETILAPVVAGYRQEADGLFSEEGRLADARDVPIDFVYENTVPTQRLSLDELRAGTKTRVNALADEFAVFSDKVDAFRLRIMRDVNTAKPSRWSRIRPFMTKGVRK